MLFLLLCGAAPAMTKQYGPNDNRSAKKIWIEIDSQILNALFCVTGFGLIPWRFRDLYYLMRYRIKGDPVALNHLAHIPRSWFRIDEKGPRASPLRFPSNDEEDLSQSTVAHPTISRTRTG